MVTGIVMASGKSERMGRNKLLLPIDEDVMIIKCLKEILASDIGEVLVVYHSEHVKSEVESFRKSLEAMKNSKPKIKLIYNQNPQNGQSESVKIGVAHGHRETEGYFFFVGDQPFLSRKVINRLLRIFQIDSSKIVVPTYENKRGMPILFSKEYREDLLRVSGDKGGREIIDGNLKSTVFVGIKEEIQGKDVDTYEEYKRFVLERDSEKRGEGDNEEKERIN